MIVVRKGTEPDALQVLREFCKSQGLSAKEAYRELKNPLKGEVLHCLKRDQGQLCVYCMCRIPRDVTQREGDAGRAPSISGETIEHFLPLSADSDGDPERGLDYRNMYAVCHGNTKPHTRGVRRTQSFDDLTCDKHRNNRPFRKINPEKQETLETIYYELNGEIHAKDPDVEFDLTDTLNLNCENAPLVSERKESLDALMLDMGSVPEAELPIYCRERLEVFLHEENPKTPYAGILIWYLQSMCAKLAQNADSKGSATIL